MRDENINELLSRYLDGDLDAHEVEIFEERLRTDTDLRDELEMMRQIQDSVSTLASAETAPRALDAIIDPLLRGKPDPIVARPWARWLAAAAVVVVGATVIIEVNRQNPGPNIESFARATEERRQAEPADRFTLAPLPTSAIPPEEQPLGASDRLLASPIPEIELDDPPALEVLGPLEEEERQATIVEPDVEDAAAFANEGDAPAPQAALEKSRAKAAAQPKAEAGLERRRPEKDAGHEGGRAETLQSWDPAPPRGRGQLFVFIDGRSAWREFAPSATCKPGRYSVRIVVAAGSVREARPVGGAASASPSQRLCAADLVLDLEIDDVADGEYPAEVVVETRGSGG